MQFIEIELYDFAVFTQVNTKYCLIMTLGVLEIAVVSGTCDTHGAWELVLNACLQMINCNNNNRFYCLFHSWISDDGWVRIWDI